MLVGAAAVLVAVVGATTFIALPDEPRSPDAVAVDASGPAAAAEPKPSATRVVVDLPGTELLRVDETILPASDTSGPGVDGFYMQSFRTSAGFAGPMLWVLTVPPPSSERNDYGFGVGRTVSVQGRPARVQGAGPGLRLTWPADDGGGVILASWGLAEDAVISIANGLRSRQAGWDATVLPLGMTVVVDSPRGGPRPKGSRVQATYRTAGGRPLNLEVSDVTAVDFEDRAMGVGTARSFEAVTVGGRQGLLIGEAGSGPARSLLLWQPTDTSMAELRVGRSTADDEVTRDDVVAVASAVRTVDESTWVHALPPSTVRPDQIATEASRLQDGVPLPASSAWRNIAPAARDRLGLAQEILVYATCAWARDWIGAVAAGDDARAQYAVVTLERSSTWPLAKEAGTPTPLAVRGSSVTNQMRAGDVDAVSSAVQSTCR